MAERVQGRLQDLRGCGGSGHDQSAYERAGVEFARVYVADGRHD